MFHLLMNRWLLMPRGNLQWPVGGFWETSGYLISVYRSDDISRVRWYFWRSSLDAYPFHQFGILGSSFRTWNGRDSITCGIWRSARYGTWPKLPECTLWCPTKNPYVSRRESPDESTMVRTSFPSKMVPVVVGFIFQCLLSMEGYFVVIGCGFSSNSRSQPCRYLILNIYQLSRVKRDSQGGDFRSHMETVATDEWRLCRAATDLGEC